jgi:hypothetical protein
MMNINSKYSFFLRIISKKVMKQMNRIMQKNLQVAKEESREVVICHPVCEKAAENVELTLVIYIISIQN